MQQFYTEDCSVVIWMLFSDRQTPLVSARSCTCSVASTAVLQLCAGTVYVMPRRAGKPLPKLRNMQSLLHYVPTSFAQMFLIQLCLPSVKTWSQQFSWYAVCGVPYSCYEHPTIGRLNGAAVNRAYCACRFSPLLQPLWHWNVFSFGFSLSFHDVLRPL